MFRHCLKLLVSFVIVLACTFSVIWACADFSTVWENEEQVFFQPNIVDRNLEFEPLYYSMHLLNYSSYERIAKDVENGYDEIVNQWFDRVKGGVSRAAIHGFLYNSKPFISEPEFDVKSFIHYFASDSFISYLVAKGEKKSLEYFRIAKSNEFSTDELADGWNYFPVYDVYTDTLITTAENKNLIAEEIVKHLNAEKDTFFKRRYAFQLIRNGRYSYRNSEVDSVFMLYFNNTPKDQIYYAAMNYATDALANSGDQQKANYYACILMNKSPEKRTRAYSNLDNQIHPDSILRFCTNKEEMSMVYAAYAFKDYFPNSYFISKAIDYDPENPCIRQLITREIAKIDKRLMPDDYHNQYYGYYNSGEAENEEETREEIKTIQDENGTVLREYPQVNESYRNFFETLKQLKAKHPDQSNFYNLCLGHLSLINKDLISARQFLEEVNELKANDSEKNQLAVSRLLLNVASWNMRDPKAIERVYDDLNWIRSHASNYYYQSFILRTTLLIMSKKFLKDGDVARAYLLACGMEEPYGDYDILDKFARPRDIDTIIEIRKAQDSRLDKLIASFDKLEISNLRAIQGTLYLREDQLRLANDCFIRSGEPVKKIDLKKLNTNPDGHPGYPYIVYEAYGTEYFDEEIDSNLIANHNARAKELYLEYSKSGITGSMLDLKQKIARKEGNLADHYFNLACLYFEMTWYGRAYQMLNYHGDWSMNENEDVSGLKNTPAFWADYYGCNRAIYYYGKALQLAKNKELKAKCLYALFRCNRHHRRFKGEDEAGAKEFAYLNRLYEECRNTRYYRIKECWGLSAYVDELGATKENN